MQRGQPLTTTTTGRSNFGTSNGPFRIGQRAARSLSERWPADPLLEYGMRFKAIDARLLGCPFASASAARENCCVVDILRSVRGTSWQGAASVIVTERLTVPIYQMHSGAGRAPQRDLG